MRAENIYEASYCKSLNMQERIAHNRLNRNYKVFKH